MKGDLLSPAAPPDRPSQSRSGQGRFSTPELRVIGFLLSIQTFAYVLTIDSSHVVHEGLTADKL